MSSAGQVRLKQDSDTDFGGEPDVYEKMMAMRRNNVFTQLVSAECSDCDGRQNNLHRSHCVGCKKHPINDATW
ncbi:MAG: hypothetical protein ACKKL6_04145 [Candidatus Komeilibacteria bacterium]